MSIKNNDDKGEVIVVSCKAWRRVFHLLLCDFSLVDLLRLKYKHSPVPKPMSFVTFSANGALVEGAAGCFLTPSSLHEPHQANSHNGRRQCNPLAAARYCLTKSYTYSPRLQPFMRQSCACNGFRSS